MCLTPFLFLAAWLLLSPELQFFPTKLTQVKHEIRVK